jgi:hypothetical protein
LLIQNFKKLCFADRLNASPSRYEALTSTESYETFTRVQHHILTVEMNTLVGLLFQTDPAGWPIIFYYCELNCSKQKPSSRHASSCLLADGISDTWRREQMPPGQGPEKEQREKSEK